MENKIEYSGLKNLSEIEKTALRSIVENENEKIQRLVKDDYSLNINIKTLKKLTKKRFIISFKLEAPTIRFFVKTKDTEEGGDWDITKATHKGLKALEFEIKHKLKSDTSEWKKSIVKKG